MGWRLPTLGRDPTRDPRGMVGRDFRDDLVASNQGETLLLNATRGQELLQAPEGLVLFTGDDFRLRAALRITSLDHVFEAFLACFAAFFSLGVLRGAFFSFFFVI